MQQSLPYNVLHQAHNQPTSTVSISLVSTLLLQLLLGRTTAAVFDDQTTSPMLLPIVYRALHGSAPRYLSDLLRRVADVPPRRRLQSLTSSELVVPLSRLVTVGDQSLAAGGSRTWNTLLDAIISAPSLLQCFDEDWTRTCFGNIICT